MNHLFGLTLIACLVALLACSPSKKKEVNEDEAKYTTSDASEIFFKNVRAIYYDKTSMDEAKLDIYKIKERMTSEEAPLVNLSIVVNWRHDEAYVLTEPNAYLQMMDTIQVIWQDSAYNESGQYLFTQGNKDKHFRFATQLYRSLQAQHQLYILEKDRKVKFMHRRDMSEPFRKTMVDYFRLVDLL